MKTIRNIAVRKLNVAKNNKLPLRDVLIQGLNQTSDMKGINSFLSPMIVVLGLIRLLIFVEKIPVINVSVIVIINSLKESKNDI